MKDIIDGILIIIIAIILIIVLGLISSILIENTEDEKVKKQIEEITVTGYEMIYLFLVVVGSLGTFGLIMFLKAKS